MSKEYETLQAFITRLRGLHQDAYCAFKVFDQLNELRAPNIVGEQQAEEAAATMSTYTGFFTAAERALNLQFLITIAKIFDYSKDSLRIEKLIHFAEQNQAKLSVDDFREFHKDREYIEELVAKYEGISRDDLLKMSERLKQVEPIIKKVKLHRDTKLAHENLKKKKVEEITYKEIETLLDLSHDMLNLFSSTTAHSTTSYQMLERQSVEDTKRVIESLQAEQARDK